MDIRYSEQKNFTPEELGSLFLSVGWESGEYPNRLARGMANSSYVVSAWDGEKLIGLARVLDDGATAAFIHYILVRPEYRGLHIGGALMKRVMEHCSGLIYVKVMPSDKNTVPFYEKYGFKEYDNYCALEIKRFGEVLDR